MLLNVMRQLQCRLTVSCVIPFPDCTVNHSLINTVPLLLDKLFHILDLVPVNAVLQNLSHTAISTDLDQDCWAATARVE